MEVASTKASLVGTRDFADSVTATIPRAEFEAALATDEPAELFIEVKQPSGDTGDLAVAWDRADLERLLSESTGPTVTLAFDRDELEGVLADVEAHGIRQKALILTVAAAAAAGGASIASAGNDEMGSTARGITPSYVAVHDEATLAERGIAATPLASTHDEATLAARGIEAPPAMHDEATLAARGIDPGSLPATHDEATLTARGIVPATPADGSDGGLTIDAPAIDATTAAYVGGAAGLGLLITAAGFAARRQRVTPA
jgi:hypothetical protein